MFAMIVTIALTVFLVLAGSGRPAATAGTGEPLTVKFAHSGSQTHPYSVGLQKLTPILEKNSGGAIKLQVFCCAQLGSERELAEGTRLGTIHMTSVAGEGALPAGSRQGRPGHGGDGPVRAALRGLAGAAGELGRCGSQKLVLG